LWAPVLLMFADVQNNKEYDAVRSVSDE